MGPRFVGPGVMGRKLIEIDGTQAGEISRSAVAGSDESSREDREQVRTVGRTNNDSDRSTHGSHNGSGQSRQEVEEQEDVRLQTRDRAQRLRLLPNEHRPSAGHRASMAAQTRTPIESSSSGDYYYYDYLIIKFNIRTVAVARRLECLRRCQQVRRMGFGSRAHRLGADGGEHGQ